MQSVLDLYPTAEELRAFAVSSAKSPVALALNGLVSGRAPARCSPARRCCSSPSRRADEHVARGAAYPTGGGDRPGGDARAAVVGRHAMLTAALLVAVGANLLLGAVNVVVLVGLGLPAAGSVALGVAIAAAGIAFAGVGAVAAQVTEGARTANGMAAAALGVAFLLRALGDIASTSTDGGVRVEPGWPSWFSPIGWAQQIRPYDDDAWWVLALLALAFIVTTGVAYALSARRISPPASADPPRTGECVPGSAEPAWPRLATAARRARRLGGRRDADRASYGAIAQDVDELVGTSEGTADILAELGGGGADLVDVFFSAVLSIMAIAVAAYAVQAVLRLRAEESGGRLEPVLATAVSRTRLLIAHLLLVAGAVVVLLLLTGVATGLAYALVSR